MSAQIAVANSPSYLTHTRGLFSWMFTLDHKRIGVMYLVGIIGAFLLGGLFALGVRTELWMPDGMMFKGNHDMYNQFFTLHGAIMVFLVIIPGVPAALGNFVLPIMLGAKDVAFPRLNLSSFYLWVVGAILFVGVLVFGGLDTGWTFYTPYSIETLDKYFSVELALLGAFILGFASIFTGLNFIVTIHKLRPEGMTFFRMPLFLWALYATAVIQVLATPVLGITLLLVLVERMMGIGLFNPKMGGDPVLFQHFFWFYSHPAVYIMILPAMGVISELISTFSRKEIFGYKFIAYSSIAIALFGFLVWGHHMFTSGQSQAMSVIFSLLTFSVSIPSAVKVFNWLTTMYKGSISLQTPMTYALGFIFLFGIGGLTGLFLGTMNVDVHLHDTYFVVAHFHYVMMGSALVAFLGGIFYWWPKMTGRMYSEKLGILGSSLVFIGFNVTFLPQFVLGTKGMPRRYHHYVAEAAEFVNLHRLSTVGAYILAAGLFIGLFCLLLSLINGKKAPANPWGSATLEWQTPSPPPLENFTEVPPINPNPYDVMAWRYDEETEGFVKKENYVPAPSAH